MIRFHTFIAQRGHEEPFDKYRSLYGFLWWFWVPRFHSQHADSLNPRVIRVIWLCFAAGLSVWVTKQKHKAKEAQ